MNDTNVAQQKEHNEIPTLHQDTLIELIQVLMSLKLQLMESGEYEDEDEPDCIHETITKVSSLIFQNLFDEKEMRESNVDCETT